MLALRFCLVKFRVRFVTKQNDFIRVDVFLNELYTNDRPGACRCDDKKRLLLSRAFEFWHDDRKRISRSIVASQACCKKHENYR